MRRHHGVLAFLTVLSVITYLDRICISVAGARMQEDLGISPERWGWVLGAFMLSYGAFEIPTGALGDRIGHRKVLTRIVVWWSSFTALTGAVSSFFALFATRFLFGAGEAGAYPNAAGAIARWFPATERARAQGLVWGASRFGGALTPLLVVPIQARFGWRASFWIFGSLGFVWAALWYWWYRDPGEKADQPAHRKIPWKALFGRRPLWHIMAMYWCYVWGSMFYLSWFHIYLVKGRGLSETEMALYSPLPFLMGMLGNLTGGFLSDHISRRYGLRHGRSTYGAVCLAVSALLLYATAATSGKITGVVLLALGFGVMDCMLPAAWALCLDIGRDYAGAVTGAMNSAGQFGGFVCSITFGAVVQRSGNYNAPIFLIASMVLLAAVLFVRIDPSRPLVPQQTA